VAYGCGMARYCFVREFSARRVALSLSIISILGLHARVLQIGLHAEPRTLVEYRQPI
jgi:hypothetical protein